MTAPTLISPAQLQRVQELEAFVTLIQNQTILIRSFTNEAQKDVEISFRDRETQNWYAGRAAAFDTAATALERALKTIPPKGLS